MQAMYRQVAGLDVHRSVVVVTVLMEQEDGSVLQQTREFGAFKRDRRALVAWRQGHRVELAVMESTGIYWKSVYAHLEAAGIPALVVNARHVKQVPGRKTDVKDSEWLASLARFGLLRGSFIPPADLRELRLVSRYRQKLVGMLAGEKNRLHKWLDDAGIRLGTVVSDIHGVSAQAIVEGLLDGQPPEELVTHARGRLKAKREALVDSLEGELTERHRLVLQMARDHIRFLESRIAELDAYLLAAMKPYEWAFRLLQTLPGVDEVSAAQILIEIGVEMSRFGSAHRLASWAGLCPGNNESAGKRKSGKTRHGSPMLRRLLCELANAAARTKSVFRAKYESLVVRRGHKRTIIALAHKMLRTIFVLLSRQVAYHDASVDYEAMNVARNAPRWIRAPKKYGYWPQTEPAMT
jgi:transposase